MALMRCAECGKEKELKFFPPIMSDDPRWVVGALQFEDLCNACRDPEDQDVYEMSVLRLRKEVKRLRAGIRKHRDASGHNLCWWTPELWNLLPEQVTPSPEVPSRVEFLRCCALYRDSLDKPRKVPKKRSHPKKKTP